MWPPRKQPICKQLCSKYDLGLLHPLSQIPPWTCGPTATASLRDRVTSALFFWFNAQLAPASPRGTSESPPQLSQTCGEMHWSNASGFSWAGRCFSPGACLIPSMLREGFWPWIPSVRPHHPQPCSPRGSRSSGLAQDLLPSPVPFPGAPPPGPLSTGDGAPSSAGCGMGTAASRVGASHGEVPLGEGCWLRRVLREGKRERKLRPIPQGALSCGGGCQRFLSCSCC